MLQDGCSHNYYSYYSSVTEMLTSLEWNSLSNEIIEKQSSYTEKFINIISLKQ